MSNKPNSGDERKLPIQTDYYRGRTLVRSNYAGKALRAMELCLRHLRRNEYESTHAEVYGEDGKLYGVMKRSMNGQVRPLFQLPLTEDE